jgi:hypothetical protein
MPTAHDYRAHHSQAARLMVEALQLESACQSVRLLASDVQAVATGVLAGASSSGDIVEALECVRRASGEMQAAREMLAERRARLWEEKAAHVRRMVETLTGGGPNNA